MRRSLNATRCDDALQPRFASRDLVGLPRVKANPSFAGNFCLLEMGRIGEELELQWARPFAQDDVLDFDKDQTLDILQAAWRCRVPHDPRPTADMQQRAAGEIDKQQA